MEMMPEPQTPPAAAEPTPSIWSRLVAVYARPTQAWTGLERRGQWWFPLLVSLLVLLAGAVLTYQRAVVPMVLSQYEAKVESGEIPAAVLDQVERQMGSPVALVLQLVVMILAVPLMTLAFALVPWIAGGFILGRPFRYRDAFAVTCWAGLVGLPGQVLTYALGWINESMANIHIGFGALLPLQEPPSKLMVGLGTFLDQGIGPLALWQLAVLVLGTAALSGAPRRQTLFAVGGLWLVAVAIMALLAGWFGRGV